ncbi:acyltransferase [Panacibacter sp. DH6]|uniref:Acyltransferase n=1 Tax=Panacibacter microcysteis TaxID=2793269 RepID=A0A931E3J8_9BACT|nr:acyltransferase [Panacibacter microcysteis]MBG9375482.1 acyltransferase [Panacibacter microcysteis]
MLHTLMNKLYVVYQRKKQKLKLLNLEKPLYIHTTATFNFHRNIKISKYCRIGMDCHIDGEGKIEIGRGTILAPKVVILSSSHEYRNASTLPYGIEDKKLPVVIGNGCWIGWGALIRPGVTIGDGAVIAMGAVVTKNVGAGEVVGGNPARTIGMRESVSEISHLVKEDKYFIKDILENNRIRQGRKTNLNNNLIK